jgi:hypothetical protein
MVKDASREYPVAHGLEQCGAVHDRAVRRSMRRERTVRDDSVMVRERVFATVAP